MNALQVKVATQTSTKANNTKKTFYPSSQDFKEYLENVEDSMQETLCKKQLQKKENYLIQLLNLFNVIIMSENNMTTEELQLSSSDVNCFYNRLGLEHSKEELSDLWGKMLSEFETNGTINSDMVNKLYKAIKTAVPDIPNFDLNAFREQIIKVLKDTKISKNETTKGSKLPNNIVSQENHTNLIKLVGDNEIIRDTKQDSGTPEIKLKVFTKDKLNNRAEKRMFRNTLKENHMLNNSPPDLMTVPLDKSSSQYDGNIPLYLEEPVSLSSNLVVHNKTLNLSESNLPVKFFDQIVDKIYMAIKSNSQQVNIRLKPDYLGEMLIKIHAVNDKVKAELFVENNQVRDMLQVHAQDVQNHILQQGYNISEISVYELSDGLEMGAFNHQFNSNDKHNQSKRTRFNTSEQEKSEDGMLVESYYDQWLNVSRINYMI